MALTLKPHKQGDTFIFYAEYRDSSGNPIDVPIGELRSQIRTEYDALIAELMITAVSTGRFQFRADDTEDWPISTLQADVQRTEDGIISSSDTLLIPVIKEVTR